MNLPHIWKRIEIRIFYYSIAAEVHPRGCRFGGLFFYNPKT